MAFLANLFCLICIFLLWPGAIIFGWLRWFHGKKQKSSLAWFSLGAHTLATVSVVSAITMLVRSGMISGFHYGDGLLISSYRWGTMGSAVALLLSLIGAFRTNPLKWPAPIAAFGSLLFWFFSAMSE